MADVSQVMIESNSYNIKDSTARADILTKETKSVVMSYDELEVIAS